MHLRSSGVVPGEIVGVYVEPSTELLVAILAVLRVECVALTQRDLCQRSSARPGLEHTSLI